MKKCNKALLALVLVLLVMLTCCFCSKCGGAPNTLVNTATATLKNNPKDTPTPTPTEANQGGLCYGEVGGGRFDDVPPDHWAYEEIELIASYGITVGCSYEPPLYCPERAATRAELAVMLARVMELSH